LEGIHKVQKHPTAFLVSVDVDGEATKIVAWPRMPVPLDLTVGDLVEVQGHLKYDTSGGRKSLHYIDGKIELVRRGKSLIGVGGAGSHTSERRS
jgi:hypothetical protein